MAPPTPAHDAAAATPAAAAELQEQVRPKLRQPSTLQATLAGAVSGAVTRATLSPLDVIKIRLQLQLEPVSHRKVADWGHSSKYKGILHCMRVILQEEGVRGLWKGHATGQMLSISYCSVQAVLRQLQRRFSPEEDSSSAILHGLAGGAAAGTASFVVYPFDILRTRFSAQGRSRPYSSIVQAAQQIFKQDGIRGFYKGLTPTLLNICPSSTLQFGYYSLFKTLSDNALIERLFNSVDTRLTGVGILLNRLGAGTLAGVLSKLTLLPLETVKKRLQVQGFESARQEFGRIVPYKGMLHCISMIYKMEGLPGFYKGGAISLIKSAAATAVTFVVYDFCVDALLRLQRHEEA